MPPGKVGSDRARTALAVSVVLMLGSLLGLLRDLSIARYFGASGATDAFLVAWMIPETATSLLTEGAMSFLLIPIFTRQLDARGSLREIVSRTLAPTLIGLAGLTILLAVAAPGVVHVLAPGLTRPHLAVVCFRLATITVFELGACGYLMSLLRAHQRFVITSAVYVVWNIGILAMILTLHRRLGVTSAALGLAVGGALMVLIQVPSCLRRVGLPRMHIQVDRSLFAHMALFLPVGLYAITRQGQVFVERFVASGLTSGSISELNYASKVGQMATTLSLTAMLVAFPAITRVAAKGQEALRRRVDRELRLAIALVLPATAFLVAFAPQVIQILFQHGSFRPADTAGTAGLLRLYSLGLIGQTIVNVAVFVVFARSGRAWLPAVGTSLGLAVTTVVDFSTAGAFGASGLAVGNAAGILVAALFLVWALNRRVVRLACAALSWLTLRCAVASVGSAALALWITWLEPGGNPVEVFFGGFLLMGMTYLGVTALFGVREVVDLGRGWRRRFSHAG